MGSPDRDRPHHLRILERKRREDWRGWPEKLQNWLASCLKKVRTRLNDLMIRRRVRSDDCGRFLVILWWDLKVISAQLIRSRCDLNVVPSARNVSEHVFGRDVDMWPCSSPNRGSMSSSCSFTSNASIALIEVYESKDTAQNITILAIKLQGENNGGELVINIADFCFQWYLTKLKEH